MPALSESKKIESSIVLFNGDFARTHVLDGIADVC